MMLGVPGSRAQPLPRIVAAAMGRGKAAAHVATGASMGHVCGAACAYWPQMTDGFNRIGSGGRTASGLAFDDRGAGSPVVLVHAGVADRRMWEPQIELVTAAHRVIRYDARGFGESLPPQGAWSQHTDLLGLLDELLISRTHLVGTSMGAGIAVEAALGRP
jgi:pimeloyl-ACP methyl ester carboxylesterase